MTVEWIDVSVPIRAGMTVFEGDPAVGIDRVSDMAGGAVCNLSRLDLGSHTGTHIDAPCHFIPGAGGIETVPLAALAGPALVVDATAADTDLDEPFVRQRVPPGAERVIFKTRNSQLWDLDGFSRDFIGMTESAARYLVSIGVRLAGIDYLSIAPAADPAPTHVALLQAGVVILEGLDLHHVEAGEYLLVALPLLIPGSDGAPTRALLGSGVVLKPG